MNRWLLCFFVSGILLPVTAWGAPDLQRDPISLDLVDADLQNVLRSFQHMADSRLEVAPELQGKVTIRLSNVAWTTALDAICESSGCTWRLSGEDPQTLEVGPRTASRSPEGLDAPLNLELDEIPVRDVFTALAVQAGRGIELDGDFSSPTSLTLDGVSVETALDALCETVGCDWSLTQDGSRLFVRDTPPSASSGYAAAAISSELRDRLRSSIDMSLAEAPLRAVLRSFGQILDVPVVFEEGFEGQVTVELSRVPCETALNTLCAEHGCRWSLDTGESQPQLKFFPVP